MKTMSLHELFEETKKNFLMKQKMKQDALQEAEAAVARRNAANAKVYELWERAGKEVLALDIKLVEVDRVLNEMVSDMMTKLETLEMDTKNIPAFEDIIRTCKMLPHTANPKQSLGF